MKKRAAAPNQMSQSGLNLLRIVLSSYFIAVSLGLIAGSNVTAFAKLVLADHTANFAANGAVFILAYFVLMGMWLRPAALLLAGWVLANSALVTFTAAGPEVMGEFWRDVALVAGLMMTYLQTSGRRTHQPAMLRRRPMTRRIKPGDKVAPRRVLAAGRKTDNVNDRPAYERDLKNADVVNIFAA